MPAAVARERERSGAYTTRTMGQSLLGDLVAEEVRLRERIVAIDEEAVLMAPYASRLPFQLMLAPRRPRARFEDDGPSGAALLHDGLRRLARHLGSSPPLNLWVRTAPRGADHFCWRIDVLPRLTHLAGLELSTERQPEHRRPRARRGPAARGVSVAAALRRDAGRLGCPAAMPPEERFVPRFAAEPPQEELPYGRWAGAAARGVPDGVASGWTPSRRTSASRARSSGIRIAAGTGAPTCPATSLTSGGYELFGYVRFLPAGEDGSRATSRRTSTSPRRPPSATPTGSMDLCDEVIGAWRGHSGAVASMTLVWGRPLLSGGRVVTAELADLAVDQCELIDERFTLIAPDDYRHDLLEIKLFGAKGQELARESLYAGDEGEEDAPD